MAGAMGCFIRETTESYILQFLASVKDTSFQFYVDPSPSVPSNERPMRFRLPHVLHGVPSSIYSMKVHA